MFKEIWAKDLPYAYTFQTNAALFFGRFLVGVQLLPNGWRKIETFALTAAGMGGAQHIVINGKPFPDQHPLFFFPHPEIFLGMSTFFDIVGASLLIIGFKGRAVGALLAGYVIIAMSIYHSDIRNAMDVQAVLRNFPFVGALLMISGVGSGAWSVDGLLGRKNPSA